MLKQGPILPVTPEAWFANRLVLMVTQHP